MKLHLYRQFILWFTLFYVWLNTLHGWPCYYSNYRIPVAHCDAGVDVTEDYFLNLQSASRKIFEHESLQYTTKEYNLELKPLFSAFQWRMLGMTTLRSFLMFYLPLLEPHAKLEDEDDEDFLNNAREEQHVDLVSPFKKSIKQIVREVCWTALCFLFPFEWILVL